MLNRDGVAIDMHRDELRGIASAALLPELSEAEEADKRFGQPHFGHEEQRTQRVPVLVCPTCGSTNRNENGPSVFAELHRDCPDQWHASKSPSLSGVSTCPTCGSTKSIFRGNVGKGYCVDKWHTMQPSTCPTCGSSDRGKAWIDEHGVSTRECNDPWHNVTPSVPSACPACGSENNDSESCLDSWHWLNEKRCPYCLSPDKKIRGPQKYPLNPREECSHPWHKYGVTEGTSHNAHSVESSVVERTARCPTCNGIEGCVNFCEDTWHVRSNPAGTLADVTEFAAPQVPEDTQTCPGCYSRDKAVRYRFAHSYETDSSPACGHPWHDNVAAPQVARAQTVPGEKT